MGTHDKENPRKLLLWPFSCSSIKVDSHLSRFSCRPVAAHHIWQAFFFPTLSATRFFNDVAKLKKFSFSASRRTRTIERDIAFGRHIGFQTS